MTFLTCMGSGGQNHLNKRGVGSRGYEIFRRKKVVTCRWGGVILTNDLKIYWKAGVRQSRTPFVSEAQAASFVREMLIKLERPSRAYQRLRKGARILRGRRGA